MIRRIRLIVFSVWLILFYFQQVYADNEGKIEQENKNLDAKIYVVVHTHSDLSWPGTPDFCMDRNVEAIRKSIEILEKHQDYRYTIETVVVLKEFLKRYPEQKAVVKKLLKDGIMDCGGFYVGPWELMIGPEGLIRNLYFGKCWIKKELDYDADIVWNPDLPGHTWQIPQILSNAGIKYFVTSRAFLGPWVSRWESPDGSSVIQCECPDSYDSNVLRQPNEFFMKFKPMIEQWKLPSNILMGAVGGDCYVPSPDIVDAMNNWNNAGNPPRLIMSSSREFFNAIEGIKLPVFKGENPSLWDNTAPYAHELFRIAKNLEWKLLTSEKLSVLANNIVPGFNYPKEDIDSIWESWLLVMEHNYGGKDWKTSDRIKKDKVIKADSITDKIMNEAIYAIAKKVKFGQNEGIPILIFNPLSWSRRDIVICKIPANQLKYVEDSNILNLRAPNGDTVKGQIIRKTDDKVEIIFKAEVPSLGYTTYYLYPEVQKKQEEFNIKVTKDSMENKYFKITIDSKTGIISSILDKEANRELVDAKKFGFGELLCREYTADYEVDTEHPTGKEWRGKDYSSSIQILENGPVRAKAVIKGKFVDNKDLTREIMLYDELKQIDFRVIMDWGKMRKVVVEQAFPVNVSPEAKLIYEVPYTYVDYEKDIHPYSGWQTDKAQAYMQNKLVVKNWLDLSDKNYGITFATRWPSFEVKDCTINPLPGYLIQPVFVKTEQTCGGDNYFYDVTGTHTFEFSVKPHQNGFKPVEVTKWGWEYNCPLIPIICSRNQQEGSLPESFSFCQVEPDNVIITTIKLSEDGKGDIVRYYEVKGESSSGKIKFFKSVNNAFLTNIIEEDKKPIIIKDGYIPFEIGKYEIQTIKVSDF